MPRSLATGATAQSSASKAKPWCHPGKLTVTVFNFSEIPFKGALAGFRKYCPGVKVSYAIQTTNPTYVTALQTQKISGNLTDIIETYDSLAPTLEVAGLVKPLDPYLNKKDFYPASYWLKGMSQSYIPPPGSQPKAFVGKQFFVPIEADATVFYVNLKDLAAAHFTINGERAHLGHRRGRDDRERLDLGAGRGRLEGPDQGQHLRRLRAS